jgi:SAM-dependent methyltransferase
MQGYKYQLNYSESYNSSMYRARRRQQKGKKAIAIIDDYLKKKNKQISELSLVDIGCSTGYLTNIYGSYFKFVAGTDIDKPAVNFAQKYNSGKNIQFHISDSMNLPFGSESFDVVTCSHVYEHVPDSRCMMAEIYRILKPEGICLFIAGNWFVAIEPHYHLPLLSILPKPIANRYLKLLGKGRFYYENHLSVWGLKKLVHKFYIIDYTIEVLQNPVKYHADEMVIPNSLKQKIYIFLANTMYWIIPTYIWILVKPYKYSQ